jgi:DNA-binding CsgD family transcriptional regulator
MVGRRVETAALNAALDAVGRGQGGALAVVGEAGIGKSRLLAELGARADALGMLVLSGSASEFECDLPFWLFVDALDEYVRALPTARLDELDSDARSELAHVLPSWPAIEGDGRAEEDRRYRTHRAMRRLLEALAGGPPLVLILDDLHWADSSSVELLCALLRRPPAAPVLLGLALRPRQVADRLSGELGRVVAAGRLTRLDLGNLDLDECRRLLGSSVAPGRVPSLFAESGGNPFYLRQLAQLPPRPAGTPLTDVPPYEGVPAAVVAALTGELATLDVITRQVLEGAAVAGDPFQLEIAAAAADLPETAVADSLDELQRRDLARPTEVPRRFRFRHPLVRRAVYESAPAAWRVGAHARCAEALADRGVQVAGRAHHIIQAARRGDRTASGLLREAGAAVARRAPAEAARWYAAALDLLPEGEPAPDLWLALARALGAAGRLAECHSALLRSLELAADDGQRMWLATECARVEYTLGHHDAAHDRLLAELARLPESGSTREAFALMNITAMDHLYRGDYDAMRDWARRAHAAARDLSRALRADAATGLALGCIYSGRTTDAATACTEAAALVDGMADEEVGASADPIIMRLVAAEVFLDRYPGATRHAERGLAVAQSAGSRHHVSVLFWTSVVRTACGRLRDAAALLDDALAVVDTLGTPAMVGWVWLARSAVATARGETDLALTAGRECVEALHDPGRTLPTAWAAATSSAALLLAGDAAAAERELLAGAGPELTALPQPLRTGAFELLTRSRLAVGRSEAAVRAAHAARSCADASGLATARAMADRAEAAVTLDRGEPRRAANLALRSAEALCDVGAVVEAATARELAGRALAAAGDHEPAVTELLRAADDLARCGAPRRSAAVERVLRGLGHRSPNHRVLPGANAEDIASLTRRELQIAHLVVDRRTNPEIAAELFLSSKTVETHVRNILRKLGLASRVEIARAVERHGRDMPAR